MDPVTGEEGFHTGVDVAAPMYTPVRAVATGTVKFVGWSGNYGQRVFLDNGGFMTQYAHLSVIKVKKGDVVAAGEVIGMVGSTGKSTGPHLHLEWWSGGIPLDPLIAFR
jgi:murein DD-endopeptidase MepM/ murein hydrolase activator NlpD